MKIFSFTADEYPKNCRFCIASVICTVKNTDTLVAERPQNCIIILNKKPQASEIGLLELSMDQVAKEDGYQNWEELRGTLIDRHKSSGIRELLSDTIKHVATKYAMLYCQGEQRDLTSASQHGYQSPSPLSITTQTMITIEFAEWITDKLYPQMSDPILWVEPSTSRKYTTDELYLRFLTERKNKQENEKKGKK